MDIRDIVKDEIIEEVYILDYDKFIMIDNLYYGGHQDWLSTQNLSTKFWADRSCGVVAAANVAYHMSYSRNLSELYKYPSKSIKDFSNHINDIYKFINPAYYGVPTLGEMSRGFRKFAYSRGVIVKPSKIDLIWSLSNVVSYIKRGLSENNPVMMLTWNTRIKHLKNHWVTITGYIQTKSNKHYIVTSNWGSMEVFSLDDWFKDYSIYKGVIYFNIDDDSL